MRRSLVLAVTALLLCGCASEATDTDYRLVEYSIDGPARLPAGESQVVVTNSGDYPHTLVVTDSHGEVVLASSLIDAGATVELPIELKAGRYSFTCRIVAEDGEGNIIDHYQAGMSSLVEVSD